MNEVDLEAMRQNEAWQLRNLSTVLTGGNAATWAEIEHAAHALAERNRELRAELESAADRESAHVVEAHDRRDLGQRVAALEAQLPAGMKHCTIVFQECAHGHGWLTADNWVPQECPTCLHESALARVAALEAEIAAAREACPAIRMQDYMDAPLLTLVEKEVSMLIMWECRARAIQQQIDTLSAALGVPPDAPGGTR